MTEPHPTIDFAALFGVNAGYVEKVYQDFLSAPESVSEEWRRFFATRLPEAPPVRGNGRTGATPAPAPGGAPPAGVEPLGGVAAKIAANMAASLGVPTATSTRVIPVKVLEENRLIINQHLAAAFRGKASFTHLIAWAMVQALKRMPAMVASFLEIDGRPHRRMASQINLGIAIDVARAGGARQLLVPNLKDCGAMDFARFLQAYDETLRRARANQLAPVDFQDTTCTLTNPGTVGTASSLPRLMAGQSFILATGAIDVPAEFQGAAPSTLSELGVSKVMTVTSTYDHRVIQGADSGEFLALLHQLLTGDQDFYEDVFRSLAIPHTPLRFTRDRRPAFGSGLRTLENVERAARVMQFIRSYRVRGYLYSNLDPLQYVPTRFPELEMASYGLTIWDLDREFMTGGVTGKPMATLREIVAVLRETYCRTIGVEYMHIADPEQKEWLQEQMESSRNEEPLAKDRMLAVLDGLVEAEAFERFLHTRFVGHKRFSLEGGETLIPALDALLDKAAESGLGHAVLGMAHRGRLNVLAHILGKPLTKIFSEFEGYLDPDSTQGSGDVKYHLGARGTYRTFSGGVVDLELACNPSHLEAVNPVVEGIARARQEQMPPGAGRYAVLPILVHGDAAFAGQGVVPETLNLSQLRGYRTGGTIHVIVNNQIGYTTLPSDARSTPYCTDVAKAIQAPIFHVNGDDPLSAVRMVRLAVEYRQRFHRDVVVDIVCYRRHGHNEGDEPSFTQPLLYQRIESHRSVRETYQDFLVRAGVLAPQDVEKSNQALQERLRQSLHQVRQSTPPAPQAEPAAVPEAWEHAGATRVARERLLDVSGRLCTVPAGFTPHPKVKMLLERRMEMSRGGQPVDFAWAETLAFATLVADGTFVRLAGQDSGRGTFSQRHSVLQDVVTGATYVPLNHLELSQARFVVVDSPLSEEAALGFEYGYSVARPEVLTLWEAQFGDFNNGAQIQIDQFLAPGEAKWGQASGLVLLLPHGYDGQGPEHSSARMERFLQLCAENNLRVANASTAAQYFHLLRRQALDPVRKPLVLFTHKSLLRMRVAGSEIGELAEGAWRPVLDDPAGAGARRVVFCQGKVYYDLLEARGQAKLEDVALVRVEQLYPWPEREVAAVVAAHAAAREWIWCQEEPWNMGAWQHVRHHLPLTPLPQLPSGYAGRPAAASPATGSLQAHKAQQEALVRRALGIA
ncbi:MAG: multifunctional oxoglutarate decarboxylase/oxoglutarate dehydrogenase thiamine pyrophosphate-binding subunit/dihydrolipoyllysine-residue succinyltransferase subunit [Planctomycetes bacterium]|nr:multifunctional oxoglutarate decarboxylase/oxoglutarate dehydrogenase thiamine pyrophosphate-binding subunit/dihydrolipoyllysine-residue succinyltransferase subunit [Planctomycetota bacterium]